MSGIAMILVYVVIIGGFYLIAIRPQKKREKAHQALVDSVEVGDSIPMQRAAIVEVDKGEEN